MDRTFEPQRGNREVYDTLFHSYQEAYRSLRGFYKRLNERRSFQQYLQGGAWMSTEEILSLPSALPDGVDYDEYLIATYLASFSAILPIPLLAEALAIEQSTGTWVPVPGETPEVRRQHIAKVIGVYEMPDYEVEVPQNLEDEEVDYSDSLSRGQHRRANTHAADHSGGQHLDGWQYKASGHSLPQEIRCWLQRAQSSASKASGRSSVFPSGLCSTT